MKTVADFKRKMSVGAFVGTTVEWLQGGEWVKVRELPRRKVCISQSNSFALETEKTGNTEPSWCDWPKKSEFTPVSDTVAQINLTTARITYTFLNA